LKKTNKVFALLVLAAITLSGCASSTPEPVPTTTKEPEIVRPSYDSEAASKLPFTINGVGTEDITIDFPAGYAEPSIVTLSSTGAVSISELNYDQNEVGALLSIRSDEGGSAITVKYPTEDSPARTSDFRVEADEDVSWAISAEALGSVRKLTQTSVAGTGSQVFMLDVEANVLDFVTTGSGTTSLAIVELDDTEAKKLQGGKNTSATQSSSTEVNKSLNNFAGYIFVVTSENPDTQGWEILFSQQKNYDGKLVAGY